MSIAVIRRWMQRSWKTTVSLGVTLVIVTVPYWEVLTGRRTAMYGDVNDFYVPEYVGAWRVIRSGSWPWWTPNVFAGHSMVGSGQFAVFYPLNAVFGWLDPPIAYRWWFFAHLWIAALAAFAWSWHRWRSRPGAIVSGIAYALCGWVVLHLVHSAFLAGAAWIPFVFLGIDLVIERWSWARASLVAVPLALIAFLGMPQLLWIAGIGSVIYVLALVAARGSRWSGAGRAAGALACGLGLGAIQLIPEFMFSRTSVRPTQTMAAAFENSFNQHHLLMLGFPYVFGGSGRPPTFAAPYLGGGFQHEVGNYLGITVIAIAVFAVVVLRRNPVVRALVALAVIALFIGFGRSTPFGHLVYSTVLGARQFRNWARTLLLVNLAFAMLAGAGVRELLRAPRRALVGLAAGAAGLGIVALVLPHAGVVRRMLATGSAGVIARGLPVVLVLGLAAAVAIVVVNRRVGAIAIVVVCALDMVTFAAAAPWRGQSISPAEAKALYDESVPPSWGRPYAAPGGIDRWVSNHYLFRDLSLLKDLYGVNGYDPLTQKEWAATAGDWASDGYPRRNDLFEQGWTADVLRVTTLIVENHIDPTAAGWRRDGPVPGLDFTRWIRTPRLPEAYLVGSVDLAPLAEIQPRLVDPHSDLRATAYVERRPPEMGDLRRAGRAGTVVSSDVLGSGKVVVDADRDAFLVLSHSWQPGWHATVDGKRVSVLRTNGLVIGVAVPRGHHVVQVGFRPPGLRVGALVGLLTLLALFLAAPLVALGRRRVKRTARP